MKKVFDVVVTLGALAVGIGFFVLDGAPILKIVAVCNLLIFLFRLIAMFKGNKAGKQVSGRTDSVGRLLASHSERLADWCDYRLHKTRITAYLTALGVTALLTVIGFGAGLTFPEILRLHIPLGLLMGEGFALLLWAAQSGQSKPAKILKRIEKNIRKEIPDAAEQEAFAKDLLEAGKEWEITEELKGSDPSLYGVVGSRYWAVFAEFGSVTIVDAARLARIETEKVAGSVRVNKVRTYYQSYHIRFFYQSAEVKKYFDKAVCFNLEETAGHFMALIGKRVGDSIPVTAK